MKKQSSTFCSQDFNWIFFISVITSYSIHYTKLYDKDERNRLAALMSDLPQGVLVCNASGQILLYNTQAQKLLQRPDLV